MDSTRWERIQTLFHDAADLPAPEQRVFLQAACGDDQELLADVLVLLEEDARSNSLLDREVAQVAHQMLAPAGSPLTAFQEFGPYRIKEMLGEGGMGVVYLAERDDLGNRVAIKILRDAWLSPARRERFASEQRTLAQLNHPGIARLYDADTLADGTPWFAMEYVEGVPLTEYCSQHRCPIETRLRLFRSVCEAVQYAHQHAVIHRDLKPSNILVKPDGTVRLLDFGIAKQLEGLDVPADQTLTGLRLMTPAYAAPEQIRGDRVGIHIDVYSLGVILFELLTGKLPFNISNLTPAESEAFIVEHEPAKPSALVKQMREAGDANACIPPPGKTSWADLDVLCLTAMHKDLARRYRSVEALIRDVDHYLHGEPLEARPDTMGYRLGKFVRRNRRAVSAAALVFIIVVSLVVFFTLRLARARNAALAEAARTERIQQFMLNLFQGGDEAAGPADSLRVVALLDRGVQEARALDGDPAMQAELYETLGNIYQKLGKLDPADSLLRSALEQRQKFFGQDSAEAAESMVALGLLRADQAQYEEAERLVRQGLAISQRDLPPNHPSVARATFALGKVLEDRGTYDPAIAALNEAVRLQSAPGASKADLAASLSELANTHFYAGHYDISDSLNRRVLEMNRELHGERHPLVADTLINLGAIQFQLGHYKESEQFNRQALAIVQSWYGKDHPETADTMTILGQSLTYQQRYGEAETLLKQSLGILECFYGPVHPRVAFALNELGNIAVRQNKLDDAQAYFTRVISIYRSIYGENHYLIGIAQSNLGGVYVKRKQYVRAEELFRAALQTYAKTLRPDHFNVGVSRIRLGNALLGQRRYAEAAVESQAGYEILMKQTSPTVKWLQTARKDLAAEYEALKQPQKAAQFRAELTATENKASATASKK
ncbi:MAG TPA: serine/threonine-protein kinase [Terriglobales bacterium]|jgi:serine/threonine-protein kinase|nr:serine/threonine-protein kinase [Terriglobales bacterium]